MKKIKYFSGLSGILLLLFHGSIFSQIANLELPKSGKNDIILHHTAYTISYNSTYHVANWVAYELTEEETRSVSKRSNRFIPDPLLHSGSASNEDYKNSGYDRGHLAPAADMEFSEQTMKESFYLSNMAPQEPGFNRGIWKKLEEQVRQWAIDNQSVYIVTGTILSRGLPAIGPNQITVPHYFYKAILVYRDPEIKAIGFIMPNESSSEPLYNYAVTIDSVERFTGVDLFYQLPDEQEKTVESTIDTGKWIWSQASHHHKQSQHESVQSAQPRRATSVRCSATTKKGTQCSRMTYNPNGLCWQHGGN